MRRWQRPWRAWTHLPMPSARCALGQRRRWLPHSGLSMACTRGLSLTQRGTSKALLACEDVESNLGHRSGGGGGLVSLTVALALLALLMAGLGHLWVWDAPPPFLLPPAKAAVPLL